VIILVTCTWRISISQIDSGIKISRNNKMNISTEQVLQKAGLELEATTPPFTVHVAEAKVKKNPGF
jgi:hypothetical protein